MKTGTELSTLAQRIIEESQSKRDWSVDTRMMHLTDDGRIEIEEATEGDIVQPTRLFDTQLAKSLKIPQDYYDRMKVDEPRLLAQNVNTWLHRSADRKMIRTIVPQSSDHRVARAYLGATYQRRDNHDIIEHLLPKIGKAGATIASCELTDTRLYIQAITDRISKRLANVGDTVKAGVVISNSEVGVGSIRVERLIWTLECRNGMIVGKPVRRVHVGRGHGGDDGVEELYRDSTKKLDDKAFFAKLGDVVDGAFDPNRFAQECTRLENAVTVDIGEPTKAVELVQEAFGLSNDERDSVLNHLARGGRLNAYGLANAVTRAAEDVGSYDRAVELERFGSDVLDFSPRTFPKN